jgi:hypothetical protein
MTGGFMVRRLLVLGSLFLALPAISSATSFDYASKGSIGAGTATLVGSVNANGTLTLTSPLINMNSVAASGTLTIATGTLTATSNPDVFDFSGGSLTVVGGGNTMFHGTFSSGTVTVLDPMTFTISGKLNNGGVANETDRHGDVDGGILVTPEVNTFGLFSTGLIGLASLVIGKRYCFS